MIKEIASVFVFVEASSQDSDWYILNSIIISKHLPFCCLQYNLLLLVQNHKKNSACHCHPF
jgi:hypothetical protein